MHCFHNWRYTLCGAQTEDAVVRIMAAYVAAIPSNVFAELPELCKHAARHDHVSGAATTLLQAELRSCRDPGASTILHEVAHTFAAASARLASIRQADEQAFEPDSRPHVMRSFASAA